MLNINKEQLVAQVKWFGYEMEESFPPCALIRPGYAIGKEVCSLIWDVAAFVTPIILECVVELGSDIWRIATCEEAIHFYAASYTNLVAFVQGVISFFVSMYEKNQEVVAAVNVYLAADECEVEEIHAVVKAAFISFIKKSAVRFHVILVKILSNVKRRLISLVNEKVDIALQVLVLQWMCWM